MCYPRRVSHPLIPYIDGAKLDVPLSFLNYLPIIKDRIDPQHPPTIHMFAALVLFATAVGFSVVLERAADRKLDRTIFLECVGSSVLAGFIVAHVFDAVFYHPHLVRADPWYVLRIWDGLSSYGGFIGAISGMYAWGWYRGRPILEYCDLCCSSFPMAWVFGRMGCTLVHDHPGALSNAWYAVRYPADQLVAPYQGRIDLGLVELVLTIPLAFACHWLWRRKPRRPVGFYIGVTLTIYAPIRFLLDFLRIEPTDVSRSALPALDAGAMGELRSPRGRSIPPRQDLWRQVRDDGRSGRRWASVGRDWLCHSADGRPGSPGKEEKKEV
jgi:phosphatidylglycerol:prolipoprotein diacylglycerol transferase